MDTIRQLLEAREKQTLSGFACFSADSAGRRVPEEACAIKTAFQDDRDRIVHCKAFRRLKYKTQVFLSPEGDHYRTRLTHTLEVSQIARTVARALALNEDLTEAIALGHDLGHTPFGHAGERVLNELLPGGFRHHLQSLRVVDLLEQDGHGLNLTVEVRDGILNHSKGGGPLCRANGDGLPVTLEGQIVRLADIVAYVNHDLDDALRAGLVREKELPAAILAVLGDSHGQRVKTMVWDMIRSGRDGLGASICFSPGIAEAVMSLRDWLYANVYQVPSVHEDFAKASHLLRELFSYFQDHPGALEAMGGRRSETESTTTAIADFIAGMTDRYAMNLYYRLFLPQPWGIY